MGKNKDGFAALTSAADINGQAISLGWSLVSDSVTVTTPTLRLPPPTPFPRRLCLCSHHADLRGLISYLDSFVLFSFHAHTHTHLCSHTHSYSSATFSYLHAQTLPLRRWPSNPVFYCFSFFSSLLHSHHATSHQKFPSTAPPPHPPNIIIPSAAAHDLITRSRLSSTSFPLSPSH